MKLVRGWVGIASSSLTVLSFAVACGSSDAPAAPSTEDAGPPPAPVPTDEPPAEVDAATPPKVRSQGVAFVHGTGDRGDASDLECAGTGDEWHCTSPAGTGYWGQATIDSERTRIDGSRRPWVAIGCPLSSLTPWPNPTPTKPKKGPPEPGSSECVGSEIATFLAGEDGLPGTEDDIDDLAIITHSGGGNVVRYMLEQHSARPELERIHAAARGVVALAAPARGTYLADRVFGFGVLSVGNDLLGVGYDDDGTDFIQTTKMALFNEDPAKLGSLSKDVAGVPFYVGSGAYPDREGEKAKVECAGANEAIALNLVHGVYFDADDPATARDRCSDGFISCASAMALANGDLSRVLFGQVGTQIVGQTHFRNHNQSRRNCDGVDLDVRAAVNVILSRPPASLRGALAMPFVPRAASIVRDLEGGGKATVATLARGEASVRLSDGARVGALEAFAEDPSGLVRVPMQLERDEGAFIARSPLPPRPGAWTIHIGTRAAFEQRTEVRLPLWLSAARGEIVDAHAVVDDGGISLAVSAKTAGARRVGVRATLVSETSGEAWTVTNAQTAVDADARGASLTVQLFFPRASAPRGTLVVRDVALVSHDDASTLEVRDRVEIDR